MGLKKSLQIRVALPLFIALILMIIAYLLIVVLTYREWVDLVEETLIDEDIAHMQRYTKSVAIKQADLLNFATGQLFMPDEWLVELEKSIESIPTEAYYKPKLNSGYSIYTTYKDNTDYNDSKNGM